MKLICLLTHGLGDFYYPLCILDSYMKERNIPKEKLKVYVDSVYFASPSGMDSQKATSIKLIESVTKNWEIVPPQYFGSGDFYGIPDRRVGPLYQNIKHDFIYYRGEKLKEYMRKVLEESNKEEETIFIYGPCLWMYEWKNNENIPIDLSKRVPLDIGINDYEKQALDNIIVPNRSLLIHVRIMPCYKGNAITQEYYNEIIKEAAIYGVKPILIGLRSEGSFNSNVYDLREIISPEQCMYLIKQCTFMISSSSMFTYHRLFFKKETIACTPENNSCSRWAGFFHEDILYPTHHFFNADLNNIAEIKNIMLKWFR